MTSSRLLIVAALIALTSGAPAYANIAQADPKAPEACTNGQPCNDGNPCTLNDFCQNGICTGNPPPPATFCTSGSPLSIPMGPGSATPYPWPISVSGIGPTVCEVSVTFDSLTHTFPDDIDMLLSGPGGQNAKIMSDVGGSIPVGNLALIL